MKRPSQAEDIARIKLVSDPQISPDGQHIAYVVTEIVLDEKRYRSRIWRVSTDGHSSPTLLTRGDGKDTSPRWSPDGSELAFLTDRWGKPQIALMNLGMGEAQQISDLADGVQSFEWTTSGRGFLVQAKADDRHVLSHHTEDKTDSQPDDPANEPKRITTLAHKADGTGFHDGRRSHVAVVMRSGRIVQLTAGDYNHTQPALSPCRRYLAFASNQSPERDNERRTDIWLMDLDNDTLQRITNHDGIYGLPQFSLDSSRLAFIGHRVEEPYGPTNLDRLWVSDLSTGKLDVLTDEIDREMSGGCTSDSKYGVPAQRPQWTAEGDDLISLKSDRGNVHIVRPTRTDSSQEIVGGQREVMNFSISSGGTIAFSSSDPGHPAEIFVCDPDGSNERQITNHNEGLLGDVEIQSPIHVPYSAEDGTEIDAWLLEPVDRRPGVKYPLVLEIHGGPHSMYGNTFFHEFQLLAAQGYGVLYTNPRGSTGYGQKFVSAAMGDWGGLDYRDVMSGLDAASQTVDWIDQNRLGVTGGSYGGYLVNWIVTQNDRFAAAITQRSTCNRHNLFGSSDLVWTYTAWEFRGLPWESTDFYYDRSPISYVEQVTTPTLVMHSENDLRCPIEQSEQWFTALKRLGKTTEFVRFPEESHELSRSGRPDRRIERLRWMLDWFGRHL
jgi:dipeptidyl aminopeptidase/acylaminoacyl peptidase